MTDIDLDAIEARAESATEGPWDANMHSPNMSGRHGWYLRGAERGPRGAVASINQALSVDAEFIAHARTDVPALVAAVRTLTAENERLAQELNQGWPKMAREANAEAIRQRNRADAAEAENKRLREESDV